MPKLHPDLQAFVESRLFAPPLRSNRRQEKIIASAVAARLLDLYLGGVAGYLSDIADMRKTDSGESVLLTEIDRYISAGPIGEFVNC